MIRSAGTTCLRNKYNLRTSLASFGVVIHPWDAVAQRRSYRPTARREIVPVVIGAIVLSSLGYYSYRAWKRMDDEWEEYLRLKNKKAGTLGIDLGSVHLRLAYLPDPEYDKTVGTSKIPTVVEDKEGARATPALRTVDGLEGWIAYGKRHERNLKYLRDTLDTDEGVEQTRALILRVAADALEKWKVPYDVEDEGKGDSENIMGPLAAVYPVFSGTLPMVVNGSVEKVVPEAVCATVAAETLGLLPSSDATTEVGPVVVIDVGGRRTVVSVVQTVQGTNHDHGGPFGHTLLHTTDLASSLTGEAMEEALVGLLQEKAFPSPEAPPDGMALQRMHDAAAAALREFSSRTRVTVDIPYLTVDYQNQNKAVHLVQEVSRKVLSQELQRTMLHNATVSTVVTNALMDALLACNIHTPMALRAVLLVGGAARSPLIKEGVSESLATLGGGAFVDKALVIPEGTLIEELVVIGAALHGDNQTKKA